MPSEPRTLTPELERRLATQVDAWRRDLLTLDRRQKLVYFKHTADSLDRGRLARSRGAVRARPPTAAGGCRRGGGHASGRHGRGGQDRSGDRRRLPAPRPERAAGLRRPWLLDALPRDRDAPLGRPRGRQGGRGPRGPVSGDAASAGARVLTSSHATRTTSSSTPRCVSTWRTRSRSALPDVDLDDPDPEGDAVVAPVVSGRADWSVDDRAVMTTFSFHKEAIYRDLMDHESHVVSHPVVRLVALGADAPHVDAFGFHRTGQRREHRRRAAPGGCSAILDADSSQRAMHRRGARRPQFRDGRPPGHGQEPDHRQHRRRADRRREAGAVRQGEGRRARRRARPSLGKGWATSPSSFTVTPPPA